MVEAIESITREELFDDLTKEEAENIVKWDEPRGLSASEPPTSGEAVTPNPPEVS